MKREYRSASELFDIWKMKQEGYTSTEIQRRKNMTESQYHGIMHRINTVLRGGKVYRNSYKTFKRLADKYLDKLTHPDQVEVTNNVTPVEIPTETVEIPIVPAVKDVYSALEDAFKTLQVAIENIIVYEVDRRTQAEKQKIIDLMDQAKKSNWISNLKQRFGNS